MKVGVVSSFSRAALTSSVVDLLIANVEKREESKTGVQVDATREVDLSLPVDLLIAKFNITGDLLTGDGILKIKDPLGKDDPLQTPQGGCQSRFLPVPHWI